MKQLQKMMCSLLLCTLFFHLWVFAEQAPQYAAAEELNKLSVMIGDETGDLMLTKAVTRAEMAAMICRIAGFEPFAENAGVGIDFSDVTENHWAAGYIQLAKQNGIINGYPDGSFLPDAEVSYVEVVQMLISALGYSPKAEAMGSYPNSVIMIANELGMTADLVILTEKPAIRSDVALLVYRSLDIPLLEQVSFGAVPKYQVMENVTLRNRILK